MTEQYYKVPVPNGYRIYFQAFNLAGVGFRKDDAIKAFSGSMVELAIEPEPTNKKDENALRVIALKKGWFRTKKLHIGYVPKKLSAFIAKENVSLNLLPRPKSMWVGDEGGIRIEIDLLGPKEGFGQKFKDFSF